MYTKTLLLGVLSAGILLSGCSSNQVVAERPQYCYTSKTVILENGTTSSSKILVECTDDQTKRVAQHKLGMAPQCGRYTYYARKGGYDVPRKGISCQLPDGTWEIVRTGIH
jgi:hypothetical protein